jgi:putative transcriptional regulator
MKNSLILKNELIFQYAAGTLNLAKSLMASTYLFLNSRETKLYSEFESYCGEELKDAIPIKPEKLTSKHCINSKKLNTKTPNLESKNPINSLIGPLNELKWNKVFAGIYEYPLKISNKESAKLIKMKPGAKIPLHSHNGKEYILVLQGSFCDEFGKYTKGNLQINDSKIKHIPIACKQDGCICLTITEEELVFFGPFAPILNLITFLKSFFSLK